MKLIHSTADAKGFASGARPLVRCPEAFSGTLDSFVEQFVLPNLPTAVAVEGFHASLAEYLNGRDPLLLLRAVAGTTRRSVYTTRAGMRFRATDNAPAWWIHAVLAQGWSIAPEAFASVVETIPAHFFDILSTCGQTANEAGFHIAHLFNVKDGNTDYASWSREEVVGRFIRNVHPCNYFLVAKSEWTRWGGDSRVLGYFHDLYRERYGKIWDNFVALARAQDRQIGGTTGPIDYTVAPRAVGSRDPAATIPRSTPPASRDPERVGGCVSYPATRLLFKRDIIEGLGEGEPFRIVTPVGTFEMTREAMYRVFPGIPRSRSYCDRGVYHYPTLPKAIEPFRVTE